MWDKKILAADRLVDPLCQQSTEEHMHPCCGPIYNRLLVMVHIYFAHRYILLINIFCSEIYLAQKYILLINIFSMHPCWGRKWLTCCF